MSRSATGAPARPISNTNESPSQAVGAAQSRRVRGAAVPAAFRLDQRTHLDEARSHVVVRDYGQGMAEVGWSFIPALVPNKAAKGRSEHVAENRDRAARRARSRLRQLVLSAKADHLLTLTYRSNMTSFEDACSDLAKFVRLVKIRKPAWVYIGVAERQKRGAWHWHLAVRGRQDIGLLRACWLRVAGDGNIDVATPSKAGTGGSLALVRYLGKYLAKGFSDERELNARRFRSSLGIRVPTETISVPAGNPISASAIALSELARRAGAVGFIWYSDDQTAGWACSWK